MSEVILTTSCSHHEAEEPCYSKFLRISLIVLGILWISIGVLNLAGVNAFSQFEPEAIPIFLSVGLVALFASSFKYVVLTNKKDL